MRNSRRVRKVMLIFTFFFSFLWWGVFLNYPAGVLSVSLSVCLCLYQRAAPNLKFSLKEVLIFQFLFRFLWNHLARLLKLFEAKIYYIYISYAYIYHICLYMYYTDMNVHQHKGISVSQITIFLTDINLSICLSARYACLE